MQWLIIAIFVFQICYMETTIRLKPSELNSHILDMVKLLAEKKGFKEVSISMTDNKPSKRLRKETPAQVQSKIAAALQDIQTGNTGHFISFSADEFEQFSQSLIKK
jgi:hypothetical protein